MSLSLVCLHLSWDSELTSLSRPSHSSQESSCNALVLASQPPLARVFACAFHARSSPLVLQVIAERGPFRPLQVLTEDEEAYYNPDYAASNPGLSGPPPAAGVGSGSGGVSVGGSGMYLVMRLYELVYQRLKQVS